MSLRLGACALTEARARSRFRGPTAVSQDDASERRFQAAVLMAISPFAFLRGSATVMSTDLVCTPPTCLSVQLCGDAHLANFGVFASPERTLLFDVNDFDETLPGPWEWDVKRLAASFIVAGRVASLTEAQCRRIAVAATRIYRQRIVAYAGMRHLDVWYDHFSVNEVLSAITGAKERRGVRRIAAKARGKEHLRAYRKLTTTINRQVRLASPRDMELSATAPPSQAAGRAWSAPRSYDALIQADVGPLGRERFAHLFVESIPVGLNS
jgi:uncharacterized protein (DUF2252 family)